MDELMRVMTPRPRNAETPRPYLRSWITANKVFFDRNQGEIPETEIDLSTWRLTISGEVETPFTADFEYLLSNACHVAFEGFDKPLGKAQIKFIRSIPLSKALSSTLLAYEMNGEPLPLKHGYPLRVLALGWTGANCVKWLEKITLLEKPFEGFYMDQVYRIHQPDQDPKTGEHVTGIEIKSIITQPEPEAELQMGRVTILGAAYAGEADIDKVEVSTDGGASWQTADFIGPHEQYAWRQWQYVWQVDRPGSYRILARATDSNGEKQPMQASWNKLGYNNNGVEEHGVSVQIT